MEIFKLCILMMEIKVSPVGGFRNSLWMEKEKEIWSGPFG